MHHYMINNGKFTLVDMKTRLSDKMRVDGNRVHNLTSIFTKCNINTRFLYKISLVFFRILFATATNINIKYIITAPHYHHKHGTNYLFVSVKNIFGRASKHCCSLFPICNSIELFVGGSTAQQPTAAGKQITNILSNYQISFIHKLHI